jgi:hypothetical protein
MSTSIRISFETLRKLHELRKIPSETIDSVIQRLIAKYLGEPEPPITLWGHIQRDKPIIRCKRLHAFKRKKRNAKTLKLENPYNLRFC